MASARRPEESFEAVAHHPPPERPVGPKGGRPPIGHRIALRAIWSVPATGCRREGMPEELGCPGRTAHRRLRAREEAGAWGRLHADPLAALKRAGKLDPDTVVIDGVYVRAFGDVGARPSLGDVLVVKLRGPAVRQGITLRQDLPDALLLGGQRLPSPTVALSAEMHRVPPVGAACYPGPRPAAGPSGQ